MIILHVTSEGNGTRRDIYFEILWALWQESHRDFHFEVPLLPWQASHNDRLSPSWAIHSCATKQIVPGAHFFFKSWRLQCEFKSVRNNQSNENLTIPSGHARLNIGLYFYCLKHT